MKIYRIIDHGSTRSPTRKHFIRSVAAAILGLSASGAQAQTASPVGEFNVQTQPRTTREVASKPADPVRTGPLAPWATDMAARGLTFDVNIYDFYQANPSAGLRTG
ncbi:porin, partial [Methylobacterium sp. E-045]|nr:porin [Methylobacterium sp. E-045]